MAIVTHPDNKNVENGQCEATFEAETRTVSSLSAYDRPKADSSGQRPTLGEQISSQGVPLTQEQWELLGTQPNPNWTPTYERVVLGSDGKEIDPEDSEAIADATVEHEVADCPTCGSPIKV